MSVTIDERVVEMRFDHQQFKSGVKETMSMLDRLKAALNLPGATKGFREVEKAAKDVKFDGISAGLEVLSKRFSTLGIVADQTIRNITNSITHTLGRAVDLVKESLISGGIRRAMNIENAHFQLQSLLKDEEKVQAVMDDAMQSVDGTAYGYDVAAKAASMFAASGLKAGEQMQGALRGLAGVAAMTNSEYEGISMIFTTVAGQGRVMADQLNQLASRGLNAAATMADYFNGVNDGSIKASAELTKQIKAMSHGTKVGEQDIRSFVSDSMISFDIFSAAMNSAFGDSAKKANETFTGSFANMKFAISKIGAEFVSPLVAQNSNMVKLFNAVRLKINDVKSALTFNKEIGNVNALSKQFTDAVLKMADAATKFVENADVTKPMELFYYGVEIVKNSAKGLYSVLRPVAKAFQEVFLSFHITDVIKMADSLESLTYSMRLNSKQSKNLHDAFKGVFDVGKLVIDMFIGLVKAILPMSKPTKEVGDGLLGIAGNLGRSLTAFTEWVRKSPKVQKTYENLAKGVQNVSKFLVDMIKGFGDFTKKVKNIPGVKKTWAVVVDVFELVRDTIVNGLKDAREELHAFGTWVTNAVPGSAVETYDWLAGSIEKLSIAVSTLFGVARQNEGFDAFVRNMQEFFASAKSAVGDGSIDTRIKTLRETIGGFVEWLKTYVAPLLSGMNLGSIIGLLMSASTLKGISKLAKVFGGLGKTVGGIGKNLASTLGSVQKTLEAYQSNLKADALKKVATAILILAGALVVLSFCDTERLIGSAFALSTVAGAIVLAMDKFKSAQDDTKAIDVLAKGLSKSMEDLTKAVKWKAMGSAIKDFGKTILMIVGSIIAIGLLYKHDKEALDSGVTLVTDIVKILVSIFAGMAIVSKFIGKDGTKGMKQASSGILMMSVSLSIIVGALSKLFKMDFPEDWEMKVGLIAKIFTGLSGLAIALGLASKVSGGNKGINAAPILSSAVSMILVVEALNKLFKIDLPEDWKTKAGIMLGIFVVLKSLISSIGKASKNAGGALKATGTILALCVFVGVAVGALMALGMFPGDKLLKGAIALGAVLLALGQSLRGAGKISDGGSWKSVLAMAAVVVSIAISLTSISMIPMEDLKKAAFALGSILIILAGDFLAVSKMTDGEIWKPIAAMVVEIIAITTSLAVLAAQPWEGLLSGATALGGVLLAMAGAFAIISKSNADLTKIGTFLVATTSLLPIVTALYTLSMQPWQALLVAGTAISEVLLSFSAAFLVISKVNPDIKSIGNFLLATLGIIPIVAALYVLSEQPWEGLLAAGTALSEVLLAMTAAMAVAAAVGTLAPGAMAGILALDAFIANLVVVLTALGALSEIPGFNEIISNGGKMLANLGDALGTFVGSVIGGVLGGISDSFPKIGENLSAFFINAKPFFDGMQSIDESVFGGIKALSEALLLLTAKGLLDGIAGIFGAKYSLADFGTELKDFAGPLREYSNEVKGIDGESVQGSANAIKILAEAAKLLPSTGGWIQKVFGEKMKLSDFGAELADFGPQIRRYAMTVVGVSEDHVKGSANAIKVLADAANGLPNTGGVLQDFLGEKKTLSNFAGELLAFGPAIVAYSTTVSGLDNNVVTNSANAIGALVEVANGLGKEGGVGEFFTGSKLDLAKFGEKLLAFGQSFKDYYEEVEGIESWRITGVTTCVQKLAEVSRDISSVDFTALGNFAKNLKKMSKDGVDSFLTEWNNADTRFIQAANDVVDAMIEQFRSRIEEFKTQGSNAMTQLIIGIEGSVGDTKTAVGDAMVTVLAAMNSKGKDARKEGRAMIQDFGLGITDKKTDARKAAEDALSDSLGVLVKGTKDFKEQGEKSMRSFADGMEKISDTGFGDAYKKMEGVGKNVVSGLQKGIEAHLGNLSKTVGNMASMVDSKTRAVLEIKSPSRKAIKTAQFYALGLSKGLENSRIMVGTSAAKLAEAMLSGVEGVITKKFLKNELNFELSFTKVAKSMTESVKKSFDLMNTADIVEKVNKLVTYYNQSVSDAENTLAMAERALSKQQELADKAQEKADEAADRAEKAQNEADKAQERVTKAETNLKKKQEAQKEKEATANQKYSEKQQKTAEKAKQNAEKAKKETKAAEKELEAAKKDLQAKQKELKKENAAYKEEQEKANLEIAATEDLILKEQMRQNRQREEILSKNGEIQQRTLIQEDVYWKKLLETKQAGNESAKYLDMTLLQYEEEVLQRTMELLQKYTSELESTRNNLMNSINLFSEVSFSEAIGKQEMFQNLNDQIAAFQEYDAVMGVLGKRLEGTKLGDYIKNLGVDSLPQLRELNSMTEAELNLYSQMYDTKFQAANQYAISATQDLKSEVQKELSELFNVDESAINLDEFANYFDGSIGSISKYLEKATGDSSYTMKQLAVTSSLAMIEGLNETKPQVEAAGKGMGETLNSGLHSAMADKKLLAKKADTYLKYFNEKQPKAQSSGSQLAGKAVSGIQSKQENFYLAGANCGQGLVDGIRSKLGAAEGVGAAIANAAFAKAMQVLAIHSPSRKMAWLGEMSGQGFVNGLSVFVNKAAEMGKSMGTEALDGAESSLTTQVPKLNFDFNPTIRPVVDLSEVKRSVLDINRLFNDAIQISSIKAQGVALDFRGSAQNTEKALSQKGLKNEDGKVDSVQFYQYNYSPKALDRMEIYRQTRNQIAQLKEVVKQS